MPVLPEALTVDSLRIWHCSYETLEPVQYLENLRVLTIGTFPDSRLDFFAKLRRLEYLRIVHLPKVIDLSPLSELTSLHSLSLETLPSWDASGKRTEVTSLEGLAKLPQLRHLDLLGVVPKERNLNDVMRCRHLKSARFHGYPKQEVEHFYVATGVTSAFVPEPAVT